MTKITGNMAKKALKEIVEKYGADTKYRDRDPDFDDEGSNTWKSCRNHDGKGKPLCIVGVALIENFGIPWKDINADGGIETVADELLTPEGEGVVFTDRAISILSRVQVSQDRGHTWGKAVKSAITYG